MKKWKFFGSLGIALAMITGCSGPSSTPNLFLNHPANPEANEAPLPDPSSTLVISNTLPSVRPSTVAGRHHLGHDAAPMGHDMKGMMHSMPVTQPRQGAASSTQCATPSSFPATTQSSGAYTCPMHPQVVSDNPGTCPKCNMKLVPKEERK